MSKEKFPVTPAVRHLRQAGVAFEGHLYPYAERGGTAHSSEALSVPEHTVVKTLVLETDDNKPLLVLMHGDKEVAVGVLAKVIGAKAVRPCDAKTAEKATGYQFGGTSPFGTRTALPVYAESTIFDLPRLYINGGKRGFLVSLSPVDLKTALPDIQTVSVAP